MAEDKKENILSIRGMSKSFGRNKVLNHINLDVKKGSIMGLMGENGAGKSTMMKCLFGTYQKDEGTIILDGKEINFADIIADEKSTVTERIEFENLKSDIEMVVSTLKDREQDVVKMRYGLGNSAKMTLEEIGNIYGVTKECIRQTELRALKKMKICGEDVLSGYIS